MKRERELLADFQCSLSMSGYLSLLLWNVSSRWILFIRILSCPTCLMHTSILAACKRSASFGDDAFRTRGCCDHYCLSRIRIGVFDDHAEILLITFVQVMPLYSFNTAYSFWCRRHLLHGITCIKGLIGLLLHRLNIDVKDSRGAF